MKPQTQTKKFKQTEIGMIPEEWEVKEFEKCIQLKHGHQFRQYDFTNKGIKVLKIGDIKENGEIDISNCSFVDEERFKEFSEFIINKGDILMALTGATIGKIAKFKYDEIVLQNYRVGNFCPLNDKLLYKEFMYYFLMSKIFQNQMLARTTQSAQENIGKEQINKTVVILPPLPEQRAIAKVLSAFDDKIELLQNMNKTLEAIGQAIFKHWFVDFEFPNEEGKPYKSSGGEMVYNEELGKEIPKGWRVGKLGEIVDVIKGCSYKSEDLKESKIALVTLKSINRGGGFNQEGYKEYIGKYTKEQEIKDGEIIVAQTDITQDGEVVGRPAIVNSLGRYSKLVASLDLQIIRPKNFSKWFIYYLLKTEDFHNHALSYTSGTTVLHLNKNAVPDFITLLPSKKILEQFDKIIQVSQNKIVINELESLTLSQIRDSLLPKLMSGKIRVPAEMIKKMEKEIEKSA